MASRTLQLKQDGAQLVPGAATAVCDLMKSFGDTLPHDHAGVRINGEASLQAPLAADGTIGRLAAEHLGVAAKPVRAIFFDKSESNNWSLAWHQDRTICVKDRVEVPGYGNWTIKAGLRHVAPPIELLQSMVTLRVHLDDVPADNAPLLIAPGSHRLGLVAEDSISEAVRCLGVATCLARAGDVWVYSTPILHASESARQPRRRRVLQVDYAACDLPGGLQWLGI